MPFSEDYDEAAAHWPPGTEPVELPTTWGRTSALTAGPADGEVVLLLHGDGATATAWAGVAAALAGRLRILAPDQPGNPGRSSSVRPFASSTDMVGWLDEVVAAARSRRLHLGGHSAGAHLALRYALAHGDRLASLSLLDPTSCFAGMRPAYLLRALPMLVRPTPDRVRRFLSWETGDREPDAVWTRLFAAGATEFDRTPIVRTKRPAAARLAALRVPTLVVVAGRSRAHDPRVVAGRAAGLLPSVTTADIPEATHHTMPVLDADRIAALVAGHVATFPAR